MSELVSHGKRNANIEFLRLLSMLMVVFLHALWKGENLGSLSEPGINTLTAWILECLSIVAVNTFMLISGYFMSKSSFKTGRLLGLAFQTVFYSLGAFVVLKLCGLIGETTSYDLLGYVFPIHMGIYWFVTSYLVVYILSPLINRAVAAVTKEQLGCVILLLLFAESLFKTLLPLRLENDEKGYSVLWFLIVYLIGAYFRLYGFKFLTTAGRGLAAYLAGAFLILTETTGIQHMITFTGHLEEIKNIPLEYNHLLNLFAAVGLFAAFLHKKPMKEKASKVILKLSPMALGVYLLHESPCIRYEWQKWTGVYHAADQSWPLFIGHLFLGILIVFAAGLLVDYIRIRLFSLIGKAVGTTKLSVWLAKIDRAANGVHE